MSRNGSSMTGRSADETASSDRLNASGSASSMRMRLDGALPGAKGILEYVRFEASPLRRSHRTIGAEKPDRRINSSRVLPVDSGAVGVWRMCGCGPFIDRDSAIPPVPCQTHPRCGREAGTVSEPPRMCGFCRGSGDALAFVLSGAAAHVLLIAYARRRDVPWRSIGQASNTRYAAPSRARASACTQDVLSLSLF